MYGKWDELSDEEKLTYWKDAASKQSAQYRRSIQRVLFSGLKTTEEEDKTIDKLIHLLHAVDYYVYSKDRKQLIRDLYNGLQS